MSSGDSRAVGSTRLLVVVSSKRAQDCWGDEREPEKMLYNVTHYDSGNVAVVIWGQAGVGDRHENSPMTMRLNLVLIIRFGVHSVRMPTLIVPTIDCRSGRCLHPSSWVYRHYTSNIPRLSLMILASELRKGDNKPWIANLCDS